jgi:hypothetical protein
MKNSLGRSLFLSVLVLGAALPAAAAPPDLTESLVPLAAAAERGRAGDEMKWIGDEAVFIAQYDDGEVDVFYQPASEPTYEFAMLFDGVGPGTHLGAVEVCFRQAGADPEIRFEIVVWDDDGPGGAPGTELANFAAHATGVSSLASFSNHSVDFDVATDDVYLGIRMHPVVDPDYRICADRDGIGGSLQPGYRRVNEAGAWATIESTFDPEYKALMLRALFSTDGVVAESLYVPSFLVDTTAPGGTTTLYAVRNISPAVVTVDVEYFTNVGTSLRLDTFVLDPGETITRNLRDVSGLAVGGDGFARGWIQAITSGDPGGDPVLVGDFFQVDVDDNFAVGERMPRGEELCNEASVRFLDLGQPTKLSFLIANPRGSGAGDPPSVTFDVLNESGAVIGSGGTIHSSANAFTFDSSAFTAASFGSLRFDFSASGGGFVFAESSADDRFSVGVAGDCQTP